MLPWPNCLNWGKPTNPSTSPHKDGQVLNKSIFHWASLISVRLSHTMKVRAPFHHKPSEMFSPNHSEELTGKTRAQITPTNKNLSNLTTADRTAGTFSQHRQNSEYVRMVYLDWQVSQPITGGCLSLVSLPPLTVTNMAATAEHTAHKQSAFSSIPETPEGGDTTFSQEI